ncbi:hypothetical protein [Deinococcus hopiensis]|uniref:hypothetical protein n=1 Tax=Deinococcus hopiensis TaxID=309885 RepID=UPI001FE7AB93|nr:hypothetical protein [Deinococcus hopiensis]
MIAQGGGAGSLISLPPGGILKASVVVPLVMLATVMTALILSRFGWNLPALLRAGRGQKRPRVSGRGREVQKSH